MRRRAFLGAAGSLALAQLIKPLASPLAKVSHTAAIPILDTHIHLYDPTRPEGVPWPEKTDTAIYRPALPDRYEAIAKPFGVVGAIAVECSPWREDNFWLLDVAAANPTIVGVIGDLVPGTGTFAKDLDRLHGNLIFRGIRSGNLWNRDFSAAVRDPLFLADTRLLASRNLALDVANPDPRLVADVLRLKDAVPTLKIVMDHLPQADPPREASARAAYLSDLRSLGLGQNVYAKLSEVLHRANGEVSTSVDVYRPWLDELWSIFGEDRLIYGSDWPNSDHLASYGETLGVVQRYLSSKGMNATEKVFWKNSIAAYGWLPRLPEHR